MKTFLNNFVCYIKTGKVGNCPFCGSSNVEVEDYKYGHQSVTFTCSECGKSDHFDGIAETETNNT